MKFRDWVKTLDQEFSDLADGEVLTAKIKLAVKKPNGELVIDNSEYRDKSFNGITLSQEVCIPKQGVN